MPPAPARRDGISAGCALAGVVLMALASLLPAGWVAVALLFTGIALLCVSHVLTPCQDQITRWWRSIIHRNPSR